MGCLVFARLEGPERKAATEEILKKYDFDRASYDAARKRYKNDSQIGIDVSMGMQKCARKRMKRN
jgi:hypothetical protein